MDKILYKPLEISIPGVSTAAKTATIATAVATDATVDYSASKGWHEHQQPHCYIQYLKRSKERVSL